MRADAGLLLPERRIGLSAHDFQQAVAAPEVILTRAARNAEAETVPSRWINRLMNLMRGLPDQGGPGAGRRCRLAALAGWHSPRRWTDLGPRPRPARRPAPRPPLAARPKELSVTEIQTLIRDPYAIYARHSCGCAARSGAARARCADARLVVHEVLEHFIRERPGRRRPSGPRSHCWSSARRSWRRRALAGMRLLWHARIARISDWFVTTEAGAGRACRSGSRQKRAPLSPVSTSR